MEMCHLSRQALCAGCKFSFGYDECEVSSGHPNGDVEKATGYRWVWQAASKMVPKAPHLLVFTNWHNPPSLNDLLLTNRIQQFERIPLL